MAARLRGSLRDFGHRTVERFLDEPGRVRWDARLVSGRTLHGRVVDEHGLAGQGVWVFTKQDGGLWDSYATTDASSHFQLKDV